MSEENVKVARGVRTVLSVSTEPRQRTLDERILVRFPGLARAIGFIWSLLSPRSRLRRALVSRLVRQGCEAANRRDFELLFLLFDPAVEYHFRESPIGGFVPPDLMGVHHGHEDYYRVWQAGIEAFDLRLDYEEVIDFGNCLLVIGYQNGAGRGSGIPVNERVFQVFAMRRGLVIRQWDFSDRDEALEAVGLPE
jgi:SnoaL-like protein